MTSTQWTAQKLVQEFPELVPLMRQHVDDLGELLPTLFMGDVAEWAAERHAPEPDRITDLVVWLEDRFQRGDADVKDMIGVGFVEMLPHGTAGEGGVLDSLPPGLRDVAIDLGVLDIHPA